MKKLFLRLIFAIPLFNFLMIPAHAIQQKMAEQDSSTPVVYSYWAGWTNSTIPDFKFDGLFPSFALMKKDNYGNFYTDYSASNNFQKPSDKKPYTTWNNWLKKYWKTGSRTYVSYGGDTNRTFRGDVIHGDIKSLGDMAGEIKANIKLYSFDGVDLDIENWWSFNKEDNEKFSTNLTILVKQLRVSLDSDPDTMGKEIMLAVGIDAAGPTAVTTNISGYTGSMRSFFTDEEAMDAIAHINIMSYNTSVTNFYGRLDLADSILESFNHAGVPKNKLVFGVQPKEASGKPLTSMTIITDLAHHLKNSDYGGMFLWGIGADGLSDSLAAQYLQTMKDGLSD